MRSLPHSHRPAARSYAAPRLSRHAALLAAAVLAALALLAAHRAAGAVLSVSVNIAPPALPVYAQPPIPAPGYLWVPGYWAYGPEGYFWVPGTWVEPPEPGLVWTPGYWASADGAYTWSAGYWGPACGYYGGIDYGYGYPGRGYYGGYWRDNNFYYNRSVTNISQVNITNVYTKTVVNNVSTSHVSYVGGAGGVHAQPTAAERAAGQRPHQGMTAAQSRHAEGAASQHELLASVNHGHPPVAATRHAGSFSGADVVRAHGAPSQAATRESAKAAPTKHAPHVAQARHEETPTQSHAATSEHATHVASAGTERRSEPKTHEPPPHHTTTARAEHTEPAQSHVTHSAAHETHAPPHETHATVHEPAAAARGEPSREPAHESARSAEPHAMHLAQAPSHSEAPSHAEPRSEHAAPQSSHRAEPQHSAQESHREENGR